ncbi:MAG: hypothetical protein ACTHW4_07630 [Actinomycetales bacterium]
MVDITEYERRGDLEAPFEVTKKQERAQNESERLRDALHCETPKLTWERYAAGDPCPGCGLPYRDEEPWEFKGTMYFTDEERTRYEAEEARFMEAHAECHSSRHSVSGSLTMHCMKCCPPPPLSPRQIEELSRIFSRPTPPHELMRWKLRLYCGHVVTKTSHYTHKTLHAAFTGSTSCHECGLDPATIVDGEAIGLAGERPIAPPQPAQPSVTRRPTKAQLEARVRALEQEVERLRKG